MKKEALAFSLVEVVLALGIVSFAVISMMALVPIGLGVYQDAKMTAIEVEIVRQINNDLQNSPYSSLFDSNGVAAAAITQFQHSYDVEGRDVTMLGAGSLPAVYKVTLQSATALFGDAPCASTSSGVSGPVSSSGASVNGITTAAGQSLAQTVRINLAFQGRSDVFSILIVNKGY